jgi:hypothetical protein
MHCRWKQDITLPKEECLHVKEGTVLYYCVWCIGHAKSLPIPLDKVNKIRLLFFILSPCMLLHLIISPTSCTYLLSQFNLKCHMLKMFVIHN